MEFIIDLKFEDINYNAIVHFVSPFYAENDKEAHLFFDELIAGFRRKGITRFFPSTYYRIDDDPEHKERSYEYYEFCKRIATTSLSIEQFYLKNLDQNKSLIENLTENFFTGENSTASIGRKYNIPVRVQDKQTRNEIIGELYYFSIEHLIPKQ